MHATAPPVAPARTLGWLCVVTAATLTGVMLGPDLRAPDAGWWVLAGSAAVLTVLIAWRHPFAVVLTVAVLTPVETTLISRLPLSGGALVLAQVSGELWLYAALVAMLLQHALKREALTRTPVDAPLALLLAVAVLSVTINRSPMADSAMNLRSLFRYAAAFYLVVNLPMTERRVRLLLWAVLGSALLQVALALGQKLAGGGFSAWLMPRADEIGRSFTLTRRGRELGAVFGTLGDTVFFGLFMCVGLAVALAAPLHRSIKLAVVVALLAVVAYSYSRAALVAAVIPLLMVCVTRIGQRRSIGALLIGGVGLSLAVLVLSPHTNPYIHPRLERQSVVQNMTGFLTPEYLERAKRQRLGAVVGTAPTVLANAPLLGYGPATEHTVQQLNAAEPNYLIKIQTRSGFEDVYWVALLAYLGAAGVALFVWMGWRTARQLNRLSVTDDPTLRWAATAGLVVIVQAAVLLWLVRAVEFRAFGLYLWLLPAIALSLNRTRQARA